jgi:hypothetical protein
MSLNYSKISEIQENFFNSYTLLYNDEKHCFLPIRKDAEKYSMYRFRKRLNRVKTEFNYFITLTFSPQAEKKCNGYIVIPKTKIGAVPIQGIDRHGNQHIYQNTEIISYLPFENTQQFKFVPLRMITNQLLRRALDLLRKRESRRHNTKLSYVWRFERGKKGGREHYHLLIKSNLCKVCLYFLFKEIWPYGFVDIKKMYNQATIKRYVNKYFTKHSKQNNLRVMSMKRRWSFSKNTLFNEVEQDDDKPKWVYYGNFYGKNKARAYFLSTIETFLEDYTVDFALKIYTDIMDTKSTVRYISKTPYKARYEKLKRIVKRWKIKDFAWFIKKGLI